MEDGSDVLIVDDGNNIRLTLKRAIKNAGFRVQTASSGEIGLQKLREVDYSLVLLDLKLPGKNGLEILRQMEELDQPARVILMTAYGDEEIKRKASRLGAIDYLEKPFDCREIILLLEKYLGEV